jgi:hypothetical protein
MGQKTRGESKMPGVIIAPKCVYLKDDSKQQIAEFIQTIRFPPPL